MQRRQYLIGAAAVAVGAIAGCLDRHDDTVIVLEPSDDRFVGDLTVDLDAGTYQLTATLEEYHPSGEGIDDQYASAVLSTAVYGETVAEVAVDAEGQTATTPVEIESDGTFELVVFAPTTDSVARATLTDADS